MGGDIVRMVEERWTAVTPGYWCECGHTHHGRQLFRNKVKSSMAPQYGFCDDDHCECRALKLVAADSQVDGDGGE